MERGYTIEPICTVCQIGDNYQPTEPSFSRCFDIEVEFELVRLVAETDDGDDPTSSHFPVPHVCSNGMKMYRFDVDQLLDMDTANCTVWNMLLDVGVAGYQEHLFMVDKILHFAAEMAISEFNQDLHILPMGVSITCLASWDVRDSAPLTSQNDEGEDEFTLTDGDYDDIMAGMTTVPMPHESFEEKLKNVIIVEGRELTRCIICLENICVGTSVTCMPCSHFYHGDCIREWLANKRICPLCRFEI